MTELERQILVGVLLSLTIAVRLVAHHEAGGMFRTQDDGLEREGGRLVGLLLRLVFLVGGLGTMVAWAVWPALVPGNVALPAWAHALGVVLAEAGVVLLVWVHIALGVHFSGTLHLRGDHQLVQHGPYASVRHPMYTSFLLLFGGLSLLTGNLLVAAITLGSQVWTIGWRLSAEEASLAARFGEAWAHYRARTGAILPRLATPPR